MFVSVAAADSMYDRNHGSFEKIIINSDMIVDLNINSGRLSLLSGETMWVGEDSVRMLEDELLNRSSVNHTPFNEEKGGR